MLPFVPQKDINGKLFVSVTNPADLGQTDKHLDRGKTGSVKQPPINQKQVKNYESKLVEDNVSAEVKAEIHFFISNDEAEPTEMEYEHAECSTILGMLMKNCIADSTPF